MALRDRKALLPMLIEKTHRRGWVFSIGGPGYMFLKLSEVDELIADLVLLHACLVELGMEYHDGTVYLADLDGMTLER